MPSVHSSPPNKRKASVDADAKVSVHSSPPKARKPPLDTGAARKPALDFGKESRKSERVLRLAAGLTEQSEDMPDALVLRVLYRECLRLARRFDERPALKAGKFCPGP